MAQLKVDLVVDDKGTPVIKKFSSETESSFDKAGVSVASFTKYLGAVSLGVTAIFATGAAVTAWVTSIAMARQELETFARLTGTSVGDLQAYGYATQKVGISMDKLADISKDVQDKLGDFIATGGGEFKDFFINVGDQVGLTAQSLQGLSGPDVLIAVKKAMDDANVSAAQQVFYLEAIGNDASKLIPLLENEGRALKTQAEEARALGVALSEIDSQSLVAAAEASSKYSIAFEGLYNRIAAKLAPYVSSTMNAVADAIGRVNQAMDDNNDPLIKAQENVERLRRIEEEFADKAMATGYTKDWEKINAQLVSAETNLKNLQQRQALVAISSADKKYGSGGATTKSNQFSGVDGDLGSFYKDLDKNVDSLDNYLTAEKKAVVTSTKAMGKEYIDAWQQMYNDRYEIQSRSLQVQIDNESDLFAAVDSDLKDFFGDLDAIKDKSQSTAEVMKDAFSGWASNMSSDMNDVLWGAELTFGSMAESFGKMVTQMIIQKSVLEPMMNGLFGSEGSGGFLTGIFDKIFPSAQGNVFAGNAAGISAYSNSIVSSPTLFPFAHGVGLMGEAGSEAIMPLTRMPGGDLGVRSAGGGGVVNNITIIDNAGGSVSQQETANSTGGMDLEIIIDQIVARKMSNAGSATNKALYSTTGASRQITRR